MLIYIDALDECDEEEMREAVGHFEELGMMVCSTEFQLRLCFANRYYPRITVQYCIEIELEGQLEHQQHIDTYIDVKLAARKSSCRLQLAEQIRQRSSGAFLWVVLVIRMLNQNIDSGFCNPEILRTLDRVPLKLEKYVL
ncbi:hypothetical protein Q7P37_000045 [Cladosporium fusiforme]